MQPQRIATWWIRWEDLNWPDPDNYDDIKAHAEGLAKAHVSAVMLFGTHFRWDWLPVFPLLHDYIATVAQELHKYGIKLYDHHSVNLVHRYSTREEMRHVMKDSGPHLPFSPTWEAAASWQYKGKFLNDWRQIDVKTGKPLYFPQYTSEGFCHRNPEFKEAYIDYVKTLIADTGVDGLSADDPMYYMHMNACACPHCRAELKRRTGIDLPPVEDRSFWFNWENENWLQWLDLRPEATGEFMEAVKAVVPENFMLTGCGGSSASATAIQAGSDARQFLRGASYVNLEMSGNTPPYKHDPKTVNIPVGNRLTNASHHQAAARERGARAFSTGYAQTEVSANHAWALSKVLGADAWIGTLKGRLGLPRHILNTLPDEKDIVGTAFGFEKAHPELFDGEFVGQMGVYFSYETRNHTMSGMCSKGYPQDYQQALTTLFRAGICPHTVFSFPENTEKYPVILLSGVSRMNDEERLQMERYLAAGGKLIVTGPTCIEGCKHSWVLPTKVEVATKDLFLDVPEGESWIRVPQWVHNTLLPECTNPAVWQEPRDGIHYHPHRTGEIAEEVVALCRRYAKPLPVQVTYSKGYLSTSFQQEDQIVVHFLAEDYDVDIDHELDRIRFHRSRINFVNKVVPIGIDRVLELECDTLPQVYIPINPGQATVTKDGNKIKVTLPENCSYAILQFKK